MKQLARSLVRVSTFTVIAALVVGCAMKITALKPASGKDGDTVFIEGEELGGVDEVRFNGTPVAPNDIVSQTNDEIVVVVPAGATTGPVSVWDTGEADGASSPYPFTVTATAMQESEPNNLRAGADLLKEDQFAWGRVDKPQGTTGAPLKDVDWFKVEADANAWATTFELRLSGRGNNPYPIDLELWDRNDKLLFDPLPGTDVTCWITMKQAETVYVRLTGDDAQPRNARYRLTVARYVAVDPREDDDVPVANAPLFFNTSAANTGGMREDVVGAVSLGPSGQPAPKDEIFHVTKYYVGTLVDLYACQRYDPDTGAGAGADDVFRVPAAADFADLAHAPKLLEISELNCLATLFPLGVDPPAATVGTKLELDVLDGGTTLASSTGSAGAVELRTSSVTPGAHVVVGYQADGYVGQGEAPLRTKRPYALVANLLVVEEVLGTAGDCQ